MANMHGAERIAYGEKMLQLTLRPYKYILVVLIVMLIILAVTPMPRSKATTQAADGGEATEERPSLGETIKYLTHNYRFMKGVGAQFIYAGMQTTVWSFTIRLALELNHHITDSAASTFMVYSYIAWFVGVIRQLHHGAFLNYRNVDCLFILRNRIIGHYLYCSKYDCRLRSHRN